MNIPQEVLKLKIKIIDLRDKKLLSGNLQARACRNGCKDSKEATEIACIALLPILSRHIAGAPDQLLRGF